MRIVVDTNTALSGLLWQGTPRRLINAARAGQVSLITSPALLAELAEVLSRDKFAERIRQAKLSPRILLEDYATLSYAIEPTGLPEPVSRDPRNADTHVSHHLADLFAQHRNADTHVSHHLADLFAQRVALGAVHIVKHVGMAHLDPAIDARAGHQVLPVLRAAIGQFDKFHPADFVVDGAKRNSKRNSDTHAKGTQTPMYWEEIQKELGHPCIGKKSYPNPGSLPIARSQRGR